jgi:hypothetical protein
MKKAKVMLLSLVLFAVIGTLFASKANRFSNHYIYTGKMGSGKCTVKVNGGAIMGGTPNVAAALVSKTSSCPDVFTVSIRD